MWVIPFRGFRDRDEAHILREVRETIAAHTQDHGNYGGFVFMVWDRTGASTVAQAVYEGSIITMHVPDFARERLMADRIERWAKDML